jgi:hypothetical protein
VEELDQSNKLRAPAGSSILHAPLSRGPAPYARGGEARPPRYLSPPNDSNTLFQPLRAHRRDSERDVVLPSIERDPDVPSPKRPAEPFQQYYYDRGPAIVGIPAGSSGNVSLPRGDPYASSVTAKEVHRAPYGSPYEPRRVRQEYVGDQPIFPPRPVHAESAHQHPSWSFTESRARTRVQVPQDVEVLDLTMSPPLQPQGGGRPAQVSGAHATYGLAPVSPRGGPSSRGYDLISYNRAPAASRPRTNQLPTTNEYGRVVPEHLYTVARNDSGYTSQLQQRR